MKASCPILLALCFAAAPLLAFAAAPAAPSAQPSGARIVRIAELEIDPASLAAYKAALSEEIAASLHNEPGVLTLCAVSVKGHPEQIRIFEIYRDDDAYQSHLRSAHFKKYKALTQSMVKSLTLLETDPILLGSQAQ